MAEELDLTGDEDDREKEKNTDEQKGPVKINKLYLTLKKEKEVKKKKKVVAETCLSMASIRLSQLACLGSLVVFDQPLFEQLAVLNLCVL